jgi:redox-sensitive bicupin YhaK (pirin superfamily)
VQLWVALPAASRVVAPAYEHHRDLPVVEHGDLTATVFLGAHDGVRSPGTAYSPLVGLQATGEGLLPLDPLWEHAVLALQEGAAAGGAPLRVGQLLHLAAGASEVELAGDLMVLGGEPLGESLLLWWNFVCRSAEEVQLAREQWQAGDARFGEVVGYPGPRLDAPPLGPARLLPRS